MRLPLVPFLIALAGIAHAQDVSIASVKPVGPDGVKAPVLGDASVGVAVTLKTPSATKPFRIRFQVGERVAYATTRATTGKETLAYWWHFTMPLDGPIPYTVTLDPDDALVDPKRKDNVATGALTPTPPKTAVEYYAPQTLAATETASFTFAPIGSLTSFETLFPIPTSATSQTVTSLAMPGGGSLQTTPTYGQPVYLTKLTSVTPSLAQTMSFGVQAANVRINAGLVKDPWSSFATLPLSVAPFALPEKVVQSTDPAILAYVAANLPADYRKSLAPIAAARRLFVAVARDLEYKVAAPVDALKSLTTRRADCGGMSALYVACLRAVGIPARVVCGWRKGDDVWHCWSEAYFPSVGWIPQDVTDCNAQSRTGLYAYCFGVVPDLNARVAVSRSTTNGFWNGSKFYPVDFQLQLPAFWYWYGGPVATKVSYVAHVTLR